MSEWRGGHCIDCGQATVGRFNDRDPKYCGPCAAAHERRRREARVQLAHIRRGPSTEAERVKFAARVGELPPLEQAVLRAYYGLNGPRQSFREIAEQIRDSALTRIAVSPFRVEQIRDHALKRLGDFNDI